MRYRWQTGALDDLEEATVFYFQEDPDLEARFAKCIDKAVDQVIRYPRSWPVIKNEIRRYVVDTFPYSLLYAIEPDHVLIVAVAHQSREPDYWEERLD